jgi:hypothetical protein
MVMKPPLGGLAAAVAVWLAFELVTSANSNCPLPLKFVPLSVTRPWYVNSVACAQAVATCRWGRMSAARAAARWWSRVSVRHATALMPAPTIPNHIREPDAHGEARNTGLESPVYPPTRMSALRLSPSKTSDAVAMLACCCGRGRPRSPSARARALGSHALAPFAARTEGHALPTQ